MNAKRSGTLYLSLIGRLICLGGVLTTTLVPLQCQEPCLDGAADGVRAKHEFNAKFDRNARGRSFSCEAGFSASDALEALEDFRYGFIYGSEEHILRSVRFPLAVNVKADESSHTEQVKIDNFDEWIAFATDHFSPAGTCIDCLCNA